jgi:hypothetical protein
MSRSRRLLPIVLLILTLGLVAACTRSGTGDGGTQPEESLTPSTVALTLSADVPPVEGVALQVIALRSTEPSSGLRKVFGLVRSDATEPMQEVQVTVAFEDTSGAASGEVSMPLLAVAILPGEILPFYGEVGQDGPQGEPASATADGVVASSTEQIYRDVDIINVQFEALSENELNISASMQNHGMRQTIPRAFAYLYDFNDEFTGIAWKEFGHIQPGGTLFFTYANVVLIGSTFDIARVEGFATGVTMVY